MRWGLIARSETDRGIGIQTLAMYQNLCPDKTLVVLDKKSGFTAHPENYPDATLVELKHGAQRNTLDQTIVRDWWQGLDVIIAVETLYDWDMIAWAKADKVKTVVHGNPEFWVATNPQPDQWIWPTSWRLEHLPHGQIVPVPVPDRPITAAPVNSEGLIRAVHVGGSSTIDTRNGTDIISAASRQIGNQGIKLTVYSQTHTAPMFRTIVKGPVEDRWSMYRDQHMLILPRKYGGLCLPALEAMASGLAVLMTDCSPNRDWPIIPIPSELGKVLQLQTGPVQTHVCYGTTVGTLVSSIARRRDLLDEAQRRSREWADANRWSNLAPLYYDTLERVRSLR